MGYFLIKIRPENAKVLGFDTH